MHFVLPPLPYGFRDLKPYISERTLKEHYEKHHQGYVNKLNEIPEIQSMNEGVDLETLILMGYHQKRPRTKNMIPTKAVTSNLFNMAAQVYNHTFYWNSLSPDGGGEPGGRLGEVIEESFENGFDEFQERVHEEAASLFGSGWIWIVYQQGSIGIIQGMGAATPFVYDGMIPLAVIDVWEHAYYLDTKSNRQKYVDNVLGNLMNWEFAEKNLSHIRGV